MGGALVHHANVFEHGFCGGGEATLVEGTCTSCVGA